MVTHCCTSLKVKIGDVDSFGSSCLCSLNCLGLSAFIYFGQVTKQHDAFGSLFLCPSNVVTPVFHHESTPHLLLDTNSVYIIQFWLVGDWFVQQTPNKPQKQWERDVMQMWATMTFHFVILLLVMLICTLQSKLKLTHLMPLKEMQLWVSFKCLSFYLLKHLRWRFWGSCIHNTLTMLWCN